MQKSNEWRAKHKTLWTWPVIGATWRILDYSMSAGDMYHRAKLTNPTSGSITDFCAFKQSQLRNWRRMQSGREKKPMSRCPAWNQPCETEGHVATSASLLFFLRILTVVDFDGCLKCQASSPRSSDHLRRWVDTSVKLSVNTGGRNLGLKAVWLEKVWKHV